MGQQAKSNDRTGNYDCEDQQFIVVGSGCEGRYYDNSGERERQGCNDWPELKDTAPHHRCGVSFSVFDYIIGPILHYAPRTISPYQAPCVAAFYI